MVLTSHHTKRQAAEATPLPAGIEPPPGLPPPGLTASARKKAIKKLAEAELTAPPGLETIAEDDDAESTAADGTSPPSSVGAAESVMDSEMPRVRLTGLPNELLSDLIFQAVLQQGHLKGVYTSFTTRRGDRCGEATVNFLTESAAEWCVHHFHGCCWAADGTPVEALLLSRGKAIHEAGPFAVGQLVEMVGLVSRADLNGLSGTLTAWDAAVGRWTVILSSGEAVRGRPENLVSFSMEAVANDTLEEPWLEAWFQQACAHDMSQFGDAELALLQDQNFGCDPDRDVERPFQGFSADAAAFVPSSAGADSAGLPTEALVLVPGDDQKFTSTSDVSTVDDESESDSEQNAITKESESESEKTAIEAVA